MPEELKLFDMAIPHPGRMLRRMLDEKSWTQDELAAITGRSRQAINELISGKTGMTPEMAVALAAAFGNSATEWMKIDAAYRLSQTEVDDIGEVQHKARLYGLAPIRDMQRRGWIKPTQSLAELESELKRFFGTSDLDENMTFPINTFRPETFGLLNPAERAWCHRARQLAMSVPLDRSFDSANVEALQKELRGLTSYPQHATRIPRVLAKYGIRLVVIEPLPGGHIDGAAFWLDPHSPVIVITVRYDRIDRFWFVLLHELAHIENRDPSSVDRELFADESGLAILLQDEHENRANGIAAALLIPPDELTSFIRRVGPLYSRTRIIQFAHRMKTHPGIIVGQLQHRRAIRFSSHQQLLAKVRETITTSALTDGYGKTIS